MTAEQTPGRISGLDVARAARLALASQSHDEAAYCAVLREAGGMHLDDDMLRLIGALAGQGAAMSATMTPGEPDAYLMRLIAAGLDRPA